MPTVTDALHLAAKGFRVFPLSPNGKHPLPKRFYAVATSDPNAVVDLFINEWRDGQIVGPLMEDAGYNIGIATDGLVVVDIDVKGAGKGPETFNALGLSDEQRSTFVVDTPSGGRHFYYDAQGKSWSNSAGIKGIGDGVDTRSYHGFVVGPGSVIDGKAYSVVFGGDNTDATGRIRLAAVPDVVTARLKPPGVRKVQTTFEYEDDPRVVAHARKVLEDLSPSYAGTQNSDAYENACLARDYGLSRELGGELLWELWAARCSPPLDQERTDATFDRAWENAENPPGCRTALYQFQNVDTSGFAAPANDVSTDFDFDVEGVEYEAPAAKEGDNAAGVFAGVKLNGGVNSSASPTKSEADEPRWSFGNATSPQDLKPRSWLVKDLLTGEGVTTLAAAGGTGKTTMMLNIAVGLAVGQAKILGYDNMHPSRKVASIIHSAEDDIAELSRRLQAACVEHQYAWEDVAPYIALSSDRGRDKPLLFACADKKTGEVTAGPGVQEVIDVYNSTDIPIGFIAFDPLSNLHSGNENDSAQMTGVMSVFSKISAMTKAAVMVMHHTTKSGDGSLNGMRGSGSISNSSRVVKLLNPISTEEKGEYGISDEEAPRYSCLTDGKDNLSLKSTKKTWFRMKSVTISTDESIGVPLLVDMSANKRAAEDAILGTIETLVHNGGQIGLVPENGNQKFKCEQKALLKGLRQLEPIFRKMTERDMILAVEELVRNDPQHRFAVAAKGGGVGIRNIILGAEAHEDAKREGT